ncbi:MAG: SGNH/GDSL hydrolase family protein [Clostridia bacterium]|nr:SGNH/GDSL hydrolase family protein [Clostridia bacterium]
MNVSEFMSVKENEKPLDRIVTDGGFCAIFRTIACIGDSLSSGEFEAMDEAGNKSYHDTMEYSWGQFIGRSCGSKIYNFSRGGMTAKEYVESFADEYGLWGKDKLAQAYIIALGVNDIFGMGMDIGAISDVDPDDYRNNTKTFAGYYAQIIQRIKILQPRARIFLVSMPKEGNESDAKRKAHRDLLEDFTKVFKKTYHIDLFTYSPLQDENFRNTFWHGHMTPAGYLLSARMIESYVDYIIRKNPEEFKQVGFIGTDLYYSEEKF